MARAERELDDGMLKLTVKPLSLPDDEAADEQDENKRNVHSDDVNKNSFSKFFIKTSVQ